MMKKTICKSVNPKSKRFLNFLLQTYSNTKFRSVLLDVEDVTGMARPPQDIIVLKRTLTGGRRLQARLYLDFTRNVMKVTVLDSNFDSKVRRLRVANFHQLSMVFKRQGFAWPAGE